MTLSVPFATDRTADTISYQNNGLSNHFTYNILKIIQSVFSVQLSTWNCCSTSLEFHLRDSPSTCHERHVHTWPFLLPVLVLLPFFSKITRPTDINVNHILSLYILYISLN